MIDVIPNWHPVFVHFAIALLSMSVVFFVLLKVFSQHVLKEQFRVLAYWNLWLGTGFAIVTAIAGWFAYNSVAHDTASHLAMTDHRNWALITLLVFIVLSIWSAKLYKSIKNESIIFTIIMVFALVLLVSTGWRGSELVYRYGLGVMSIPQVEAEGHEHEHAADDHHRDSLTTPAIDNKREVLKNDKPETHDHSTHEH